MHFNLHDVLKPCVYSLTAAGHYLYVGMSDHGLERIFNGRRGDHPNRRKAFRESDLVSVQFYDTAEEASQVETMLIHEKHPEGNTRCLVCIGMRRAVKKQKTEELRQRWAQSRITKKQRAPHPAIAKRHRTSARLLTIRLGGVPDRKTLIKSGLTSLAAYIDQFPALFAEFPRINAHLTDTAPPQGPQAGKPSNPAPKDIEHV